MADRSVHEAQLLAHLAWVQRVVAALCRRHRMESADAEDCLSWAVLRLLEDDYAVLRKFRGESSLPTFLTAVLATLHREYRVRIWGRWRPSAAARRMGPIAVRLETLVYRDRYSVAQAIHVLRLAGDAAATDSSDRQLAAMFAALPPRSPRDQCPLADDLPDARDGADPEAVVLARAACDEARGAQAVIAGALASLDPEDRRLVRMRFWDGLTVADIARTLCLRQKPLYRRLARALRTVRLALETAGISSRHARELLDQVTT
jgi:RNA polymerase sigma factor for flagellar operon FliA